MEMQQKGAQINNRDNFTLDWQVNVRCVFVSVATEWSKNCTRFNAQSFCNRLQ